MITPESHEWVLLSALYHHVLALSSSPEQAKIDISNARDNGWLRFRADRHEHIVLPGLRLEPGEQPPDELVITSNQPLPKDNLWFDEWDWERSRAIARNDPITKAVFEYVDIVVHRDDALALWPTASVLPAAPAQDAPAMPQLRAPQMEQAIDLFRTGAPGRPTARDFIVTEAKRRISLGEMKPQRLKLARFAQTRFYWYEQERQKFTPHGPKVTPGTIENLIRDFWRSSLPGAGEDKI